MKTDACERCGSFIPWGIYRFSMNQMGEPLCIDCQKKWREMNMPKKLAQFINKQVDKGL